MKPFGCLLIFDVPSTTPMVEVVSGPPWLAARPEMARVRARTEVCILKILSVVLSKGLDGCGR
jgi:hypothetical protein